MPATCSQAPRWRRDGADHDRDGGGAGLFAAAWGPLDHYFGWRFRIRPVAIFAGVGALAYGTALGENPSRDADPGFNPLAIVKNYASLVTDRRFCGAGRGPSA